MKLRKKLTPAVMVYVILLLTLQIFLLTVAMEGFLANELRLAWVSTGVSAVLATTAFAFYRFVRR